MKGLKAQVLARIEVLEEREREGEEELLVEVAAIAEQHRLIAGTLEAALGD